MEKLSISSKVSCEEVARPRVRPKIQAIWLWLPEVLTIVLPAPSVDSMQLPISKGKVKCTCSVYILSATK